MKYIKTAFLFIVIITAMSMAPLFVFAITTQDSGSTAGASYFPPTQDNGTTAGTGNAPATQDNGSTAGTGSTPTIQDNGTTAGTGNTNTPATQDNGTTAGTGSTPSSSLEKGGGSGSSSSKRVIRISNIQVTPINSTIPTTILTIGQTYTVSWSSSIQNVNTAIKLVSTSSGLKISIGAISNPSNVNSTNWTVPAFATSGNYILYFTDPDKRITNALNLYKISSARSTSSAGFSGGGTGGGNLSETGKSASSIDDESVIEDLIVPSENGETADETQTAAAGNAFVNFWSNKYVFWFFVLLLIITGILLVLERRNQNPSPIAKQPNVKPFMPQQQNTQVKTPVKPVNTNTEKINQPPKLP